MTDDIAPCATCGKPHVIPAGRNGAGRPACEGHVRYDRESYVKGQDRKPLPEPRPCMSLPRIGAVVCNAHGGRRQEVADAGKRRDAEAKAEAAVIRRLGDSGQPVTDPIGTLCAIAGRAVKFMELIGQQVDELEHGTASDERRAEIALYERSMGRAATVVESLIRMGIAERLAKAEQQQTAAIVAFIDGVLADLGHNPRAPEVAGVVAARLELVS